MAATTALLVLTVFVVVFCYEGFGTSHRKMDGASIHFNTSTHRSDMISQLNHDLQPVEIWYLMQESDVLKDRLASQGVDNVGAFIRSELYSIQPSELQRRSYYEAHQAHFGGRSYEQSWASVDQLVRIDILRRKLNVAPPAE